jgi:phosphatidylglycerol:prolipoprotein diacylglycerol transferase
MLTGIAVFFLYCHIKGINPLLMADVVIPSLFIGIAIGRIGCFLNGCCYGDRCELPWAVQFPAGSAPFEALVQRGFLSPDAALTPLLHPTQLYSTLDGLLLAFLTASYFKVRPVNGAVLAVGWLTYPVTRFMIEFLRGDELGKFNTSLTISQWVSIGLFVSGVMYTVWLLRRSTSTAANPRLRMSDKLLGSHLESA